MGSFYTNVTAIGPSAPKVAKWLTKGGRRAFLASDDRCTVVFDAQAEAQDESNAVLARDLSAVFECPVVAVTVHDDSVLLLEAFDRGSQVDRYNSSPGYFTWDGEGEPPRPQGGNAIELLRLCGRGDLRRLEDLLQGEFLFENERHRALIQELGLPIASHGVGYQYLAEGEYPSGTDVRNFTRT